MIAQNLDSQAFLFHFMYQQHIHMYISIHTAKGSYPQTQISYQQMDNIFYTSRQSYADAMGCFCCCCFLQSFDKFVNSLHKVVKDSQIYQSSQIIDTKKMYKISNSELCIIRNHHSPSVLDISSNKSTIQFCTTRRMTEITSNVL